MKQVYNILLISVLSLIMFACQNDEEALQKNVGYLRVALEQSKDVNTKAVAYNPKQMHVVIKNAEGVIVKETDDFSSWENEEIALAPGNYTIEAYSNAYPDESGEGFAYYAGKKEVPVVKEESQTVKVVCSLANVKVTVAFEQAFLDKLGTGSVDVEVKSAKSGVLSAKFKNNVDPQVTYFPVSDLTVSYTVKSVSGKTNAGKRVITEVQAKDHYVLNFKNQVTGSSDVTVTVDPSTHEYTYNFIIDPTKVSSALLSANVWSRLAYLTATEIVSDNMSIIKFQYRKKGETDDQWVDVETVAHVETETATATVQGLVANTDYEYQLTDGIDSYAKGEFRTDTEIALYNGGFEFWNKSGDTWYPEVAEKAGNETAFWNTSNPGTSQGFGAIGGAVNPTSSVKDFIHGGTYAAQLKSTSKVGVFAAASLYTGNFKGLSGMSANMEFGKEFAARPIALKGFYKYEPVVIDKVDRKPAGVEIIKGQTIDQCAIFIALAKKSFTFNNSKENEYIQYETDPNIIAYGELPSGAATAGEGYVEFNIPLKYKNLTEKPTHIIVVCSASKYGDYMTGGVGSTLHVDDFSLVYDGEPTLWK